MSSSPSRPVLTLGGCLEGARLILPICPGIAVFGAAFGAAALQKGLTLIETVTMSAVVYSGAAQMVAMELWPRTWSTTGLFTLALVTFTVGARLILMSASLRPWLSGSPPGRLVLNFLLLTDASWLAGTRYHGKGGRDVGILIGSGLLLWTIWCIFSAVGHLAGALLSDPRRYGIDLILPVYFAFMLVPLWKGRRAALPWVVAAAVALAVQAAIPGYLYIVAGALAGAVAGAFVDAEP